MKRTVDSKRHHWWPETLSGYWKGSDGKVSQLSPDGRILRERPASFGFEKHTHNIRIGTPWNSSFEAAFGRADSAMSSVVDWLITLEALVTNSTIFAERLLGHAITTDQTEWLAECLASLIVRSPALRNRIRNGVEYHRKEFGLADYQADKSLVALNMRPMLSSFAHHIKLTGKFAVLFSEDHEFIFGDGFLQSFPTVVPIYNRPKCIIPLTPAMSVLFCSPSRYASTTRLATLRLRRDEVDHCNRLVQVYSCDRIFFRNDAPARCQELIDARHYELRYHSEPWSDELIKALAAFHGCPAKAA
jgi:Protein of unknown function (DUF4238)